MYEIMGIFQEIPKKTDRTPKKAKKRVVSD